MDLHSLHYYLILAKVFQILVHVEVPYSVSFYLINNQITVIILFCIW